ncbi:hypothetical protein [Herbaspirillum robiniae]|uniref:hypothetical protein n=1 Tax=Herbaspirillum robiniae TaxID=2014887 RepID=UPI0009A1B56E|nr:hypothetical protein [Herbaspirillum robiniae]
MTVGDLIEELKKLPQHYSVVLVTPSTLEDGSIVDEDIWGVDSVGKQSGWGEMGSVVRIDGGDL